MTEYPQEGEEWVARSLSTRDADYWVQVVSVDAENDLVRYKSALGVFERSISRFQYQFERGMRNPKEVEARLALEIARVRHGQDVTASDLANRLMPFILTLKGDWL